MEPRSEASPRPTSERARVRVLAAGLVQGVFFRDSLRRAAETRRVTGWVRNLPDGRVEAELQGDRRAVEEMVRLCRQGPGRAEVEHLEVQEVQPVEAETGFRVR